MEIERKLPIQRRNCLEEGVHSGLKCTANMPCMLFVAYMLGIIEKTQIPFNEKVFSCNNGHIFTILAIPPLF